MRHRRLSNRKANGTSLFFFKKSSPSFFLHAGSQPQFPTNSPQNSWPTVMHELSSVHTSSKSSQQSPANPGFREGSVKIYLFLFFFFKKKNSLLFLWLLPRALTIPYRLVCTHCHKSTGPHSKSSGQRKNLPSHQYLGILAQSPRSSH